MPRTIKILNLSTRITDEEAKAAAVACNQQLSGEFSSAWGMVPPIAYFSTSKALPLTEEFIAFVDVADPNAYGFHGELPDGSAYGIICVPTILDDANGTALMGPISCSCVLSHELLEWAADPMVNAWRDGGDGYEYALEVCDAVQGGAYVIQAASHDVTVSNFLFPAWFDRTPQDNDRFDLLGVVKKPFTLDNGGYTIRRKAGTDRVDIWGERAPWKLGAVPITRGSKRIAADSLPDYEVSDVLDSDPEPLIQGPSLDAPPSTSRPPKR